MEPQRHLLIRAASRTLVLGSLVALALLGACDSGRDGALGAGGLSGSPGGGGEETGGSVGGEQGGAPGGSGTAGELSDVARPLDGFVFRMHCGASVGGRLCETSSERPYPRDPDPALSGARLVDETLTLGGDPEVLYDIELLVEGVVEAKNYVGGDDQSDANELPADGLYVGGKPGIGNAYNVYLLRVADPPSDYYLNAIASADDSRLRRSVFPVKYTARVRARGGTTVRLVLTDPNAHALENCADPDDDGCVPVPLDFLDDRLRRAAGLDAEPLDGQLLGLLVTGVERASAP